jgi:tRNA (pseudouridine54-N1)-methyltransferase
METPPEPPGLLAGATAVYIVVSPTARTSPDWPSRGYAGPSGRLDVIARTVLAALEAEPGSVVAGVLLGPPNPPITMIIGAPCIEGDPGERGVMEVFRRLLKRGAVDECTALRAGPEWLLHAVKRLGYSIYILEEGGLDIAEVPWALEERAAFLAGAHLDPPGWVLGIARRYARASISVGPRSLLTSHVVALLGLARRARGLGR